MNFGIGSGFSVLLNDFWKEENIKLERAFNFAREEGRKSE
jgi:hypothetical protein